MTRRPHPVGSSSDAGRRTRLQKPQGESGAPDGGWGWIIVTASFIINCIVDGVCYSFGVFYVDLLEEFKDSSAKTSLVGALLPGIYLIIGPLVGGLTNKYGCRRVTIAGSLLASASIFLSSFSVNLDMLIVTYGVLTGVGFGMMYLPSIVIVGFYFERLRALATGIAVCGSGVGTFIFAPFGRMLLDYFGWRGGNQILAGVILNGVVCGAVFRPLQMPRKNKQPVVVAEKIQERPRERFIPKRGLIMQKIIEEKRRQRTISTGSLDGTIITKDNRLVKPSELSLNESLYSLKVPAAPPVLETIPEVNLDSRSAPINNQHSAPKINDLPLDLESMSTDINLSLDNTAKNSSAHDNGMEEPSRSKDIVEFSSDCEEPFLSDITFSTDADIPEKKDFFPSMRISFVASNSFRPLSWLSSASSNQPEVDTSPDMRTQTTRPLYRHDTFYSGSVLNIPEVKRNMEVTSYASIPSTHQTGSRKTSTVQSNLAPATSILKTMLDFTLLKSFTFILLSVALVLPFLGFFTPFVYVTSYALSLDVTTDDATLLLSILGLSNAFGRLLVGFLADRSWVDCVLVHNASLVFAGVMTCVVPVLRTYNLLCLYAVLFGICIAAFVTLKSILMVELLGLQRLTTAFGLVGLFQGLSTLIGGPLSGAIFDLTGSYVDSFLMAGSLIGIGGLLCLPIRKVARWEARREPKATAERDACLISCVKSA